MEDLERLLLGKTEEEAYDILESLGLSYRIIQRDDEKYIYPTTDIDPNRINLYIDRGTVAGFFKG